MIGLRQALTGRAPRRLATAVALVAVVLIVAWEHSGMGGHEMDGALAQIDDTCLAVLGTALLGLAGFAVIARRPDLPRPAAFLPPIEFRSAPAAPLRSVPARASPAQLQSFRC